MWITRVSLKGASSETVQKTLEWCNRCRNRDPTFQYTKKGNFIIITSPTKDVAFKRGSAIYKRFNLNFNVERRYNK